MAVSWFFAALCAVLLWVVSRRKTTSGRKWLIGLPLAAAAIACALIGSGMRLERQGGGIPRFVTFSSPDDQAEKIEAERAKESPAPAITAPAALAAAPEPTASAKAAVTAAEWPAYRGANRDGVAQEPILTDWPGGKLTELWRKPVGGGWASFSIAGNLLFTIEQRRTQEVIAAYDVSNGREIWAIKYDADFRESMGGPGPRTTPTWDNGKLYSLGATGEFYVLDAGTGKILWRKNILEENGAENLEWAMSASPLIVDDLVIVQPGGSGNRSIVAYNKVTGAKVWGSLGERQSYTSPMLATLDGKRQILTATAAHVVGLEPATGKLLWKYPWSTEYDINAAQPIVTGPNHFVISAGYGHGAALVEVRGGNATTVWENKRLKNKFNSSVFLNGFIYGFDEAIFTCIEASTGETKWKAGRYGYGQVLLASNHLVVTTEQGEVVLLKADPSEHKEVAKFQALDGRTWNVPAIAGGRLFVRNATEMAAYRISPGS